MPQIPIIEQRTSASSAGLGPGPSGGRGIQAVGEALQGYDENMLRIRMRDDAVAADGALSTLRMRSMERLQQAQSEAAADGKDFTPNLMKDFDGLLEESTQDLDPRVKNIVRQQSTRIRETVYGQALHFEAGARQAYRSNEFENSTDRRAVAVELDPDQFDEAVGEQAVALAALNLPPELRQAHAERIRARLTEAAATGLAKQDPSGVLAELKKPDSGDERISGLSPEARDRVERQAQIAVVDQSANAILKVYEKGGPKAGANLLGDLSKSNLDPQLQAEVRSQVQQGVTAMRVQRREEMSADIVSVERSLGAGTAGTQTRDQVERLFRSGALTVAEYGNYQGQIDAGVRRRSEDDSAITSLATQLQSGLPVDPKNAEQKKGLAAAFGRSTINEPLGSEGWQSIAVSYADKAKLLPQQADSWLSSAARSTDPKLAGAAANFFGVLSEQVPEAAANLDTGTKAMLGLVSQMVSAGAAPQIAFEQARKSVFETSDAVVQERRKLWNTQRMRKETAGALVAAIDDQFDGWFSKQPEATAGLMADFESQARVYFETTGDAKAARNLAWRDIQRVYAVSTINGKKELLPYAPEVMFPGLSPDVVRADIGRSLAENVGSVKRTGPDGELIDAAVTQQDVRLVPFDQTARTQGRTWYLGITDEYGAPDVLRGKDHLPLAYELPVTPESHEKATQSLVGQQHDDLLERRRQHQVFEEARYQHLLDP